MNLKPGNMNTPSTHPLDRLSATQIAERLTQPASDTYDCPTAARPQDFRLAGVLLPLIREDNHWHLLFIRRSVNPQDHHSGQVAFAGGKHEPGDSDLKATALRECEEEIGVKSEHVHLLGGLNDHYTVSRFRVTPWVGVIPWPYPLRLDSREVAHAFSIPLAWLANKNHYEVKERRLQQHGLQVPVVYFSPFEGEQVWGATARMVLSLVETLSD